MHFMTSNMPSYTLENQYHNWKTTMNEDVSPNKNGDFSAIHVSFPGRGGGKTVKPSLCLKWKKVADLHSIKFLQVFIVLGWNGDSMLPSAHLLPETRKSIAPQRFNIDTQTAIFKGSHFYQGPSFWVSSRWLSGDVVFVINCTIIPHTTEAP